MGVLRIRTVGELADGLVLAAERYDPRRSVPSAAGRALGELVHFAVDTARGLAPDTPVLVLDTTHAADGFVIPPPAGARAGSVSGTRRRLRAGDVLLSRLRPYLRQVAFVDAGLFEGDAGPRAVLASPEFFVLRGREGLDAAALVPWLLSEEVQAALAAAQEGGHHPRVPREAVEALMVPAALLTHHAEVAAGVRADAELLRAALERARHRSGAGRSW
jgi:hypothetical protein